MFSINIIYLLLIIIYCEGTVFECVSTKCVSKCCRGKAYLVNNTCHLNTDFDGDFSDLEVYNTKFVRNSNAKDSFRVVEGHLMEEELLHYELMEVFLVEDGNLYIKTSPPNAFPKWQMLKNDHYCIEYYLGENNTLVPWFWVTWNENVVPNQYFKTTALLISCVFLLLVLIIYVLLKELRNLKGLIVMAYVISLLGAFTTLAAAQILFVSDDDFVPTVELCYELALPAYFFFLATFCWMNVMSFDIWWTLRSITSQMRKGRTSFFNITTYCIYAWCIPLVMTIAVYCIDTADLEDKPWIIKPNIIGGGCFIDGNEKMVYLYIPMMILIVCNWVFYIMTAYNYWMFGRETHMLDSRMNNKKQKQKQRFIIYVKLSLVMGISWILEVISTVNPDFPLFFVTDAYNAFIGLAIFLIFVCKRKIYFKLRKRFAKDRQHEYSLESRSQHTTLT